MNVITQIIKLNNMRIKLLLITAFSALCLNAMAQQEFFFEDMKQNEPKVAARIGFVGGFNLSTLTWDPNISSDKFGMRPGFNAGVAANIRFCKRNERSSVKTGLLAFQPEIRYATMGGNNPSIGTGYLMVPVMFQVYPLKNLYVEVGPEFALNLSHTPNNVAIGNYQLNLTNLKANDIMLGAGLGYAVNGFSVGVRYNHGFSDMAENLGWNNSVIQINLGYAFSLAKRKASKDIILDL